MPQLGDGELTARRFCLADQQFPLVECNEVDLGLVGCGTEVNAEKLGGRLVGLRV